MRPFLNYKTGLERFRRTNTFGRFPRHLFLKILLSRTVYEWLLSWALACVSDKPKPKTGRNKIKKGVCLEQPRPCCWAGYQQRWPKQSKIKDFALQKQSQMHVELCVPCSLNPGVPRHECNPHVN